MAAPRTTIPELPEQLAVTETDELVVQNGPTTKRMTVGRLTTHNSAALVSHINNLAGAHQASSISAVPAGPPFTGADVQTQLSQGADAINQLSTATTTNSTNLTAHLTDPSDAHDASAISVVPSGDLSSFDVQAALVELQQHITQMQSQLQSACWIRWTGTQAEYDAIAVKDPNTLYVVY